MSNSPTLVLLIVSLFCLLQIQTRPLSSESARVPFKEVIRHQNQTFSLRESKADETDKKILLAIKVANHAFAMPTFLATLEKLKCNNSKGKCDLWCAFLDWKTF